MCKCCMGLCTSTYFFTTIEKLQISAARIVTGTNIYAGYESEATLVRLLNLLLQKKYKYVNRPP